MRPNGRHSRKHLSAGIVFRVSDLRHTAATAANGQQWPQIPAGGTMFHDEPRQHLGKLWGMVHNSGHPIEPGDVGAVSMRRLTG